MEEKKGERYVLKLTEKQREELRRLTGVEADLLNLTKERLAPRLQAYDDDEVMLRKALESRGLM